MFIHIQKIQIMTSFQLYLVLLLSVSTIAQDGVTPLTRSLHDYINSLKTTWTAGHNARWEGVSNEDIKGMMGTILDDPNVPQLPLRVYGDIPNDLPESFDSRERWPECSSIGEIRDQANCGSCWAFGAVEVMSDRICIQSGGKLQTRVSAQDLLTCCDTCGNGCRGGYEAKAWQFFENIGIVTGGLFGDNSGCQPYSLAPCDHHTTGQFQPCPPIDRTPACHYQCHEGYPKEYIKDKIYGLSAYAVRGEENIMYEIYKNGPVEAAFTVYEDFLTYKGGVYQHVTGSKTGGHAIKIIGWGSENGVNYWLCVNSWNEDWGEKGTFRFLRGSNHLNIESQVHTGQPDIRPLLNAIE